MGYLNLAGEKRRDCVGAGDVLQLYVEPLQRSVSGKSVNARQAVDCGEVADAAEQADRDARRAP